MRVPMVVVTALVLGGVCGMVAGYWEFGGRSEISTAANAPAAATQGPQPAAVVDASSHKFGEMEVGDRQSHTFIIRNEGKAPLKLTQGETTCKCTLSRLEDESIPPGGSGTVTLEWKGEGAMGPFRQTATIHTNDPRQPNLVLSVEGELTEAVMLEPMELVLSTLPAREPVSGEVKIFARLAENLEITSHRFENARGAEQFEITFEPLDADELAAHKAASGVLATVTSKPTLPLGPIRQKILLDTNLENRPNLEFVVSGTVVSDISVIGPDYSTSTSVLRLGLVKSQAGDTRTLRLVTRGPHRHEIEFKVLKKTPEFLEVTFGDKVEVNKGLTTQVPVTISVPPGSPVANHLGTALGKIGEVLIGTNHPDLKEVPIRVYFAVEN